LSLPDVVHRFKSLTTTRYSHGVKSGQWESFSRQFWQRNYYEHIVRDESELSKVSEYIANNPKQWALDRENPVSSNILIHSNSSNRDQSWEV